MRPPAIRSVAQFSAGFTLIEMAVVIFVMALILGSILIPLSTQVEQRQLVDTQRQLEDVKEALIGFAISQAAPALPCPDKTTAGGIGTPNDGVEDFDPATGLCAQYEGNLPWATLGLAANDAWNNRYRYRVTPEFANRPPPPTSHPLTLATSGLLRTCTAAACTAGQLLSIVPPSLNSPAAVILSHGPNGWGAVNAATGGLNLPPGCGAVVGCVAISDDEQANADGNDTFVSRAPSAASSAGGEFDDIVTWLSPHTLKHRLVAAGKLP